MFRTSFIFSLALLHVCCKSSSGLQAVPERNNQLFQFSVIPALQRGVFDDNSFSASELKKHGTFGLGTFNGLDGELILINDTIYQAKADSSVNIVSEGIKIPFAVACFFKADSTVYLDASEQTQFYHDLAKNLSPNYIYAIRASGNFDSIVVRSVHSQEPPYTTLTAATATQSVYGWSNVQGDVVSFFSPQYLSGVNVPGFHSHFISSNRKLGGHILRFRGAKLKVEIARIRAVNIEFPYDGQFRTVNLFDIDPNDIYKAEK